MCGCGCQNQGSLNGCGGDYKRMGVVMPDGAWGNPNTLGIAGLSGLLGATLPAYSQIRAGFHVAYLVESYSLDSARQNVEDCLWGSGLFYDLAVSLTPGTIENYLIVQGITNYDFADVNDASGAIQDALLACDTGITIKSRDAVAIDFIPQDQAGKPGVARPVDYPGNQPSRCDWSKLGFSEYVKCQFGFEPSSLLLVGGIAALFLLAPSLRRR